MVPAHRWASPAGLLTLRRIRVSPDYRRICRTETRVSRDYPHMCRARTPRATTCAQLAGNLRRSPPSRQAGEPPPERAPQSAGLEPNLRPSLVSRSIRVRAHPTAAAVSRVRERLAVLVEPCVQMS